MIHTIAPVIFIFWFTTILYLSLRGKLEFALMLFVPIFPLQNVIVRFQQFPLGQYLINTILIAMILGWFLHAARRKEKILEQSVFNNLLIIMVLYTFYSLWQGYSSLGSDITLRFDDIRFQNWKNYVVFPLLFFIVFNNIKNSRQIKLLVVFMAIAIFLMNYYTINQLHWLSNPQARAKINGTFVWLGPNELAAFFATYSFVLLGILFFDKSKLRRLFFLVLIILSLYCVLFLFSRGAYLAILAGIFFFCFLKAKKLLIPILFIIIFWNVILPKQVVDRINETRTEEGTLDTSSETRIIMWQRAFQLFKESPITGSGFNTIWFMGLELGDTHNIYLKVLAEQGIIGIVIFLILLFKALSSGISLYLKTNDNFLKGLGVGFSACVIAMIVANMFGDRWTHPQLGTYFWVFLALVVRGNKISQAQTKVVLRKNKNANSPAYK